jgi:hypothetical protein
MTHNINSNDWQYLCLAKHDPKNLVACPCPWQQFISGGVTQCRDLCDKAVKEKEKLEKAMTRMKAKKATLLAEKTCIKGKDDSQEKIRLDKQNRDALKKLKTSMESCKTQIDQVGEDLLLNLVKVMRYKGSLKDVVQTTRGFEAGTVLKQFVFWLAYKLMQCSMKCKFNVNALYVKHHCAMCTYKCETLSI